MKAFVQLHLFDCRSLLLSVNLFFTFFAQGESLEAVVTKSSLWLPQRPVSPPGNDFFGVDVYFAGIFYYFLARDLRASLFDRRKILYHDGKCVQLNNPDP